jgi:methylated-DNA-[protein]-cysteine S-methyltransferase
MSRHPVCVAIEPDLLAAAADEATDTVAARVREHVAACEECRNDLDQHRAVGELVRALGAVPTPEADIERARAGLEARLADLRSRIVHYGIFDSALGRILIAISEHGVALVEYVDDSSPRHLWWLDRARDVRAVEDGDAIAGFRRELVEYLAGRRTRLDWPLDLGLARSDFHRAVLRTASEIPFGAVTSYANLAAELGKPSASRAVAQALRWNPVPIVVPCHRIVGSTGTLIGYAGSRVALKQRLLGLEGVATTGANAGSRVLRERMYVRDGHDAEYCVPTCGSIATRPLSRLTLFARRERAESLGLRPCTACRPDLHPIDD